jgi:hypothetical protein
VLASQTELGRRVSPLGQLLHRAVVASLYGHCIKQLHFTQPLKPFYEINTHIPQSDEYVHIGSLGCNTMWTCALLEEHTASIFGPEDQQVAAVKSYINYFVQKFLEI